MAMNFVLIDFENVRPKGLDLLRNCEVSVTLFLGATQTKVPVDIAETLQPFGDRAGYVKIAGSGRNALDFHIACYLGELVVREPEGCFHVISKDTGFDPLIRHLRSRGFKVGRSKEISVLPFLGGSCGDVEDDDQIARIVKNLAKRGDARPRDVDALVNTIRSLYQQRLKETDVQRLLRGLESRGYVVIADETIAYALPGYPP